MSVYDVHLCGDSEADIYELFAEPRGTGPAVHWLIRLCHDRSLDTDSAREAQSLCAQVLAQPVLFTKQITVRGRQPKVGCEERGRRQEIGRASCRERVERA